MTTALHVLIVEDSPDDVDLMTLQLDGAGYNLDCQIVDNEKDYLAALDRGLDVILADWSLPQFSGLRALQIMRKMGLDIPFIIVSGSIGEEAAVDAMRQGAVDYILKDRSARLPQAVRRALEDKQLQAERRKAEIALWESEQRYRLLIDTSPDGIVVCDPAGSLLLANPQFTTLLGYSDPADVISQAVWQFCLPELREQAIAQFQIILAEGKSVRYDAELVCRDGTRLVSEISASVLRDASGATRGLIGIVRDITERKQHERELEAMISVSAALRIANTRAEMSLIVLDQLVSLLHAAGAALEMLEPASGVLLTELGRGVWAPATGVRIPSGGGLSAQVLATGQPYMCNDIASEPRLYSPNLIGDCIAVAGVPLVAHGRIIGLLWIASRRILTDHDMRLTAVVADIAANAIYRAALYEQTELRLGQLTALREIDQAINASLDLRITLSVILAQTAAQLSVDAVSVLLLDSRAPNLEYAAGRGFRSRGIERTRVRLGEGHAGRAAIEQRTVSARDLAADGDAGRAPYLAGEGFVSQHVAPLVVKGKTCGVLEVFHRARLDPDAEWLGFFETLAGQVAMAVDNARLFDSLQRSNTELSMAYDATIEGWSRAMELRDRTAEGRTQHVADLTAQMAQAMGLQDEQIVQARRGALLHDIGMLSVPDSILAKPGPLTDAEWQVMRGHPQIAYDLLSPIAHLRPVLDIPFCHHEKWDGTGYPRGLKAEQIPITARIFSVLDVWDALTRDRPYRPAWPRDKALAYMRDQSGWHFDPRVVEACIRHLEMA